MRFALLLSLALMFSACVSPRETAPAGPAGSWHLAEMSGAEALPADARPVTLTVTDAAEQNVTGRSFVNQYGGTLALGADGRVATPPVFYTTKMAGPEPLMALEQAYFERWEAAARMEVRGGALVVLDAGGAVLLRFTRQP